MKYILTLLCELLMMSSCTTYRLSKKDLAWQPYEEGDTLIFQSSAGVLDTVAIKSVEKYTNPEDPLCIICDWNQSLFVSGARTILDMHTSKWGTSLHFILHLEEDTFRYSSLSIKTSQLSNLKSEERHIYKLIPKQADANESFPSDLGCIYWSKKLGYIELEYKNGFKWTLKSFKRGGKELLSK